MWRSTHNASSGSSSPEALDAERKLINALFADIKGSTDLMEELDLEEHVPTSTQR